MSLKMVVALFGACALSACAMLTPTTQEQHTAVQFASGAHAAAAAEMVFLRQVQAIECLSDFYADAFAFAAAGKTSRTRTYPRMSFDLLPNCEPKELTSAQLQVRQGLMNTVAAYGDAIQALMSGSNDQTFDAHAEATAKELQSMAKQEGISMGSTRNVAALNAAVASITQYIVDRREYGNVKDAAANIEPSLEVIVDALKAENTADAAGMQSKLGGIKNDFRVAVLASRQRNGVASLFDIAQAHALLASMTVTADPAQLNAVLDALVKSNKALAVGDKATATQMTSNLIDEGKKAIAVYNGSK